MRNLRGISKRYGIDKTLWIFNEPIGVIQSAVCCMCNSVGMRNTTIDNNWPANFSVGPDRVEDSLSRFLWERILHVITRSHFVVLWFCNDDNDASLVVI